MVLAKADKIADRNAQVKKVTVQVTNADYRKVG
jgi:hypothetical protein